MRLPCGGPALHGGGGSESTCIVWRAYEVGNNNDNLMCEVLGYSVLQNKLLPNCFICQTAYEAEFLQLSMLPTQPTPGSGMELNAGPPAW